jgi:hypothetical protein
MDVKKAKGFDLQPHAVDLSQNVRDLLILVLLPPGCINNANLVA